MGSLHKRQPLITILIAVLTLFAAVMGNLRGGPPRISAQSVTETLVPSPTLPPSGTISPTATALPVIVTQYGLFETQFAVDANFKNAFDPSQIDVTAQFTGPDGKQTILPAFWMQPFENTCKTNCPMEQLQPTGPGGWRVRFSPAQVGDWQYTIQARDTISVRVVAQGRFSVTPSKGKGFIRVGQNHHYFAYDNSQAYFPIGTNLGWSWSGAHGTLGYLDWLKTLHDSGANFARLFIDVPWFIGLDWKVPAGDYSGTQEDAWRLDTILQAAEQYGIALQLVMIWNQGFINYAGLPVTPPSSPARPKIDIDWVSNPYNVAVGGFFGTPAQVFVTDQGRQLLKRRLRYIIARWGYSTSVFAWEVIDQLDRITFADPNYATDWLKDAADFVRQIDPYHHLVTAGVRDAVKTSLLDPVVLDFKQTRFYQRRPLENTIDQSLGTLNTITPALLNADRPVVLTEFSLNPWFEPTADDPTGVHLRETMWTAMLSGTAGSGSTWWWDTYLFPRNLTPIFAPLAAFSQGIPWNTSNLQPIDAAVISESPLTYKPFRITGYNTAFGTTRAPDYTYRVTPDGVSPPISSAPSYLYGVTYGGQLVQPQKYIITPPVDTTLTISIRRVSDKAAAKLVVLIDDKPAAQLSLGPSSPPAVLTIPISAGPHSVVLDNKGDDFLQIDGIEIADYIGPLRVLALADHDKGIFLAWVQHRDYTWQNVAKSVEAAPLTVSLRADGMPPGLYQLELWDPFSGNVVGEENVMVSGNKPGEVMIKLLPLSKMLAVRLIRVAAPETTSTPTLAPTATVKTQ